MKYEEAEALQLMVEEAQNFLYKVKETFVTHGIPLSSMQDDAETFERNMEEMLKIVRAARIAAFERRVSAFERRYSTPPQVDASSPMATASAARSRSS